MKKENKCNECTHSEVCFGGQLICQHKASMEGIEALQEYYLCSEVDACEYFDLKNDRKKEA